MKKTNKTKEQLFEEIKTLQQRVAELEVTEKVHNSAEQELRKLGRKLEERVKELNCLYSISELRNKTGISRDEVLQGIVKLLPPAWQYPEITCARIFLPNQEFKTTNFRKTVWKQTCDIVVHGNRIGSLEVCYLEEREKQDDGPFLKEEKKLLDTIGERIERLLEHTQAEEQAKQQQQQLIQMDKMAALGTLVSGVAHEINNPNNFIMLNTPLLSESWESIIPILEDYYKENGDFIIGGLQYSEMRENIPTLFSGILDGSKRIKQIVESLKGFAREDTADLTQAVDINAVLKSALTLLSNKIKKCTEKFSVKYGEDIPQSKGNFQQLEQVIINLVQNSCEALRHRQKGISIVTTYDKRAQKIIVTVQDEGIGIPKKELTKIMDPFYTTKRQSGGLGLGLSISASIVKNHGGTLEFTSTPKAGTTAILTLPVFIDNNAYQERIE